MGSDDAPELIARAVEARLKTAEMRFVALWQSACRDSLDGKLRDALLGCSVSASGGGVGAAVGICPSNGRSCRGYGATEPPGA